MTDGGAIAAVTPPVALYVHVPFCVSLCPYCDFVVVAGAAARGPRSRVGAFVDALLREIDLRGAALDARLGEDHRPLDSVYLGGGTPSLLPAEVVAAVLARVRERFGIADGAEVTLEVNPGPDERGDPSALRAAGVTRLSFGAQSMDLAELRRLGRRHRPEDVADAVVGAREAGVGSVNVDLLYDVPDGGLATWMGSLDAVLDLAPDHLSLYALSLDDPVAEGLTGPLGDHLPTTTGARRWREGARSGQDEDRAVLEELVQYFGNGNRSAYLRATLKVMRSVKLAEELRQLQAYGQGTLAAQGLTIDDVADVTRRVLKGRS